MRYPPLRYYLERVLRDMGGVSRIGPLRVFMVFVIRQNTVARGLLVIGAFFCPEIRAFPGLGARFLQPFPKSLVTVKYYSNTKMAVNSR